MKIKKGRKCNVVLNENLNKGCSSFLTYNQIRGITSIKKGSLIRNGSLKEECILGTTKTECKILTLIMTIKKAKY
jgi:hypothetical protein